MVQDAGPPDGLPVLVYNGSPGSRHLSPGGLRLAGRKGLRLIGVDPPGYGGSTAQPGRRVADCAADASAIAKALGITSLAVWGISGGGPLALASAALLPRRSSLRACSRRWAPTARPAWTSAAA
jgi:pimeloyl-ACP methyl ester carboxylesterase